MRQRDRQGPNGRAGFTSTAILPPTGTACGPEHRQPDGDGAAIYESGNCSGQAKSVVSENH